MRSAGRLRGEDTRRPGAVLIATSEFAVTTTTVVVGAGGGCLLIDPGVTVPELAGLAAELAGRGLRPRVAWSTHPHWDHVLWHRDFGGDVPRFAAPAAAAIAASDRETILGEARQSAPGHEADLIARLVPLDDQAIPWDGPAAQLIVHNGHAPGHGAVFLPGSGTLVAGDMCSDIEIPLLDTLGVDPIGDYRLGLRQLSALRGVRQVIPGHGHAGDGAEFHRRLAADTAYLDALERRKPFGDPRITEDWLRAAHDRQLRLARERGAGLG